VKTVIADGICEIWLTSEDTGAYGRDLGAITFMTLADLMFIPSEWGLTASSPHPQ